MKKKLGVLLTILGLLLLAYSLISFLKGRGQPVSPVPLKEGVKVIELSPTP